MSWDTENGIIWGESLGVDQSRKIAAFDLDGTLIKTKSGYKIPKNGDDWMWWHDKVPKKLK